MNTIVKLEEALTKRNVAVHLQYVGSVGWIAQLINSKNFEYASGQGISIDLAVSRALQRWDTSQRTTAPDLAPPQLRVQTSFHPDLPGHEHCGQPYCATCRAPYDATKNTDWTTCTRLLCPSCRATEEQTARQEKHSLKYYLDLDYPVTLYEHHERGLPAGFVAECKDLPGTVVEEDTIKETYDTVKKATKLWIETAAATGQRIPLPSPAPKNRFKFPRPRREDDNE